MDKNVEKLKLILSGEVTENSDLDVGMECRVLGWDEIIDRYDPDYDENVTKMKSYCGKTFVCLRIVISLMSFLTIKLFFYTGT